MVSKANEKSTVMRNPGCLCYRVSPTRSGLIKDIQVVQAHLKHNTAKSVHYIATENRGDKIAEACKCDHRANIPHYTSLALLRGLRLLFSFFWMDER